VGIPDFMAEVFDIVLVVVVVAGVEAMHSLCKNRMDGWMDIDALLCLSLLSQNAIPMSVFYAAILEHQCAERGHTDGCFNRPMPICGVTQHQIGVSTTSTTIALGNTYMFHVIAVDIYREFRALTFYTFKN
jgi:hypothetical protein